MQKLILIASAMVLAFLVFSIFSRAWSGTMPTADFLGFITGIIGGCALLFCWLRFRRR